MIKRKLIKITSRGPIYAKGGIYGPITTPFMEETTNIFRMISGGIKVVEILDNGSEIELKASNFDKDNNIIPVKSTTNSEPPKPSINVVDSTDDKQAPATPVPPPQQPANNTSKSNKKNNNVAADPIETK